MIEVAKLTHDEEAVRLSDEMLSGVVVLKPHRRDIVVPVQGPEPDTLTIALVPLLKEDKKTTKTARQLLSDSSKEAARFTENDPGRVYFNAEIPMSGLWKGLIGLHEVKHAKLYRQGEYRDGDEMDHWTEEADVFSFEHRLMEILGGEAYRARMAEMVTSLAKANPGDNPPQLQLGNPSALDLDFLDEIFGPNQSDRERTIRASTVWIDLVLRVLDQKFPDDPLGEKAHFLRQIYSS
jgi:hypothetical protein